MRIADKRRIDLEERLKKLAGIQIYILADHDRQVEQDLYQGAFLPVAWKPIGDKLQFQFLPERRMPLYQYAEAHRRKYRMRASEGLMNAIFGEHL